MKSRSRAFLIPLVIAASLRCGDSPTQPRTPTPIPTPIPATPIPATPTPTPIPAATRTPTPIPAAPPIPTPIPTATPIPVGTPIPTIGDLNGIWRGTFRQPGSTEQIQATVQHSGSHVTLSFGGVGGWEFRGTLRGGLRGGLFLTGSLYCCVPLDDQFVDTLRGEAFATSISLDGAGYQITLSR